MSTSRVFIALHLLPAHRDALTVICDDLRQGPAGHAARWVSSENMHITLKFLGDVEDSRLPEVYAAVRTGAGRQEPFTITVEGLGCYPSSAQPRVVWAGVSEGADRLKDLAGEMDLALSQIGFAREKRPFSSHITLARSRRQATRLELDALGGIISGYGPVVIGELLVRDVHVIKSNLLPVRATLHGPLYRGPWTGCLGPFARRCLTGLRSCTRMQAV
jgi:RNA 2',3'-cyclic 3'-phosphodiesterase